MGKAATVVPATMLPAYCLGSELPGQPAGFLCDQTSLQRLDALQVDDNYDWTGHQLDSKHQQALGTQVRWIEQANSDTGECVI